MSRILLSVAISILLIPIALTAFAKAEEVATEEIVITAFKAAEEVEKIPANVTIITGEQIKESPATTVGELLKGEEGLVVRDLYGTGTKTSVDMRGFAFGLNTVVLVDGRKVNEIDLSGVDWNLIPLENIERIEISRGSGNVLYGDNSMAGVINIITKKGMTLKPSVDAEVRGESFNGNSESLSIGGAKERFTYYLMAKNRDTEGYRENSEFDGRDLNARITADPSDSIYLDLSGGYHTDHQGLPGGLTEAQVKDDRRQAATPDDKVDYDQYYYNLTFGFAPGKNSAIEAGYTFRNRKFDSDIFFLGSGGNIGRDTDTQELKVKFTGRQNVLDHKNQLVLGAEALRSEVNNASVFTGFGINVSSDVKKTEEGYYIEDEFSLNPSWTLTGGWRHNRARFEDSVSGTASGNGKDSFSEDAARLGVTYNHSKGGKIFFSFSDGFRLPTTDELFAFDGTIVKLKPERAATFEAGIVHPLTGRVTLRLTLYTMNVENELFFNPATFANENLNKTLHRGAEFGFTSVITDRVTLNGNWTYTRATFESGPFDGNTMPLVPENTANLNADIKLPASLLLTLDGRWAGKRFLDSDVDNSGEKLDGYTAMDAKLSYAYKMLTAYIGVNNAFDSQYSEYGVEGFGGTKNFYPAPKRWYYAGIRMAI